MPTTKTKTRKRITQPPLVVDVLRWHIATQLTTPEQKASAQCSATTAGRLSTIEAVGSAVRRLEKCSSGGAVSASLDALERLRVEGGPGLPVLLMSACADEASRQTAASRS